jgi:hypothetical protein
MLPESHGFGIFVFGDVGYTSLDLAVSTGLLLQH